MTEIYDMAVIGGGPGGYSAALRGRQLGLTVALFILSSGESELRKLAASERDEPREKPAPSAALDGSGDPDRISDPGQIRGILSDLLDGPGLSGGEPPRSRESGDEGSDQSG